MNVQNFRQSKVCQSTVCFLFAAFLANCTYSLLSHLWMLASYCSELQHPFCWICTTKSFTELFLVLYPLLYPVLYPVHTINLFLVKFYSYKTLQCLLLLLCTCTCELSLLFIIGSEIFNSKASPTETIEYWLVTV